MQSIKVLILLLLCSNVYANTLVNCNTTLVSGTIFYRGVEDGFGYSGYNTGSHELVECVPIQVLKAKPIGNYTYYVNTKLVSSATSFTRAVQLNILTAPPKPPKNIQIIFR